MAAAQATEVRGYEDVPYQHIQELDTRRQAGQVYEIGLGHDPSKDWKRGLVELDASKNRLI